MSSICAFCPSSEILKAALYFGKSYSSWISGGMSVFDPSLWKLLYCEVVDGKFEVCSGLWGECHF